MTFVKLGQVLSSREDVLPPQLIKALSTLQMDSTPIPWTEAEAAIRHELGRPTRRGVRHDRSDAAGGGIRRPGPRRDASERRTGRREDPASSGASPGDDRPRHPGATGRRGRAAHRVGARLRSACAGGGVRPRPARRAGLPHRGCEHRDAPRRDRPIAVIALQRPRACTPSTRPVTDARAGAGRRHTVQPAARRMRCRPRAAHDDRRRRRWTRCSTRSPCAACSTPTCTPAT